jgi:hypothetical protein
VYAAKEPELLCAQWFGALAEPAPSAECAVAMVAGLLGRSVNDAPDVCGCAVCQFGRGAEHHDGGVRPWAADRQVVDEPVWSRTPALPRAPPNRSIPSRRRGAGLFARAVRRRSHTPLGRGGGCPAPAPVSAPPRRADATQRTASLRRPPLRPPPPAALQSAGWTRVELQPFLAPSRPLRAAAIAALPRCR